MFGLDLSSLVSGSPAERVNAIVSMLEGPGGPILRQKIAGWISEAIPVAFLVPERASRWRPLVRDSFQFYYSRLSARRLAERIVAQFELPADAPPEVRLLRLITKTPGLQKFGQVLARNRRLEPALRTALSELENGMSDMTAAEAHSLIRERLGDGLETYAVKLDNSILSEASVSAVVGFSWNNPGRERERGVFKVLKPYVPECFDEDMELLQKLGEHLGARERGYGFAVREVREMLSEVRLLLGHELDFEREQDTLKLAARAYRASIGIRVPRLIAPLCRADLTAMSAERGVKVTDAFPHSPIRRERIAGQLIEALIAVPLFAREDETVFHADPHAGNLLYDEPNRELIVLDWALAERLSLETRRQLVRLALMMILRNPEGVSEAIQALSRSGGYRPSKGKIGREVNRFFAQLPPSHSPGTLDAMVLLDEIALEGVRFPPALFLFRKSVFTLDAVLHDVSDSAVRIDTVIARDFLTRCAASLGMFHTPLALRDFVTLPWNALLYSVRTATQAARLRLQM